VAELIRSYVQASTKLPDCKWRRRLSDLEKHLWTDLTHQPTYSGIFTFDVEERAWYYNKPVEEITKALDRFANDGKIYRDRDYIWVVEFVDYQHYTPPSWKATAGELMKLENKTSLVSDCIEHIAPLCSVKGGFMDLYTRRYETIRDDTRREIKALTFSDEIPESATQQEAKMLKSIFGWRGWTGKQSYADWLEYLHNMSSTFPGVNLQNEIDKIGLWLVENQKRSPGKLFFRNWIERSFGKLRDDDPRDYRRPVEVVD
jgi:hypothetical protein